MTDTYSTNLKLIIQQTGTNSGTWGDLTNTNIGTLIEQAISGYVTQAITDGAATVITIPDGATGVARNMYLELTGALTAARVLEVPSNKKLYFIYNNTTGGYAVTVKVSGQTGVSVPNGKKMILVSNGTDIVEAVNYAGSITSGSLTLTGNLSVGGTSGFTGVSTFTAQPIMSSLTASQAVFTDGSKGLVSNAITGTGNVVMSTSPTLVTPNLGTPASGVVTNLTGTASININGTVGATTPTTGAFTTLSASSSVTFSGGTANGVVYLNGSKVATSGSALVFDGSNLGLGVTPSAWGTGTAFQGNGGAIWFRGAADGLNLTYNYAYYAGTNLYLANGYASRYTQVNGTHSWYTAPSGTAGNAITFTQAMTLDASGNLGIGTSSPAAKLDAFVTPGATSQDGLKVAITGQTGFFAFTGASYVYRSVPASSLMMYSSTNMAFLVDSASPITWHNSGGERMRLDSSGNLGLGVTPSGWSSAKAIQIGSGGLNAAVYASSSGVVGLTSNYYFNGSDIYASTGYATRYYQYAGQHVWNTAPSGTAGNAITFTQAMTLTASGVLQVGTTAATGTGNVAMFGAAPSAPTCVVCIGTANQNVPVLQLTNWTGSTATRGPRIVFDNSGIGGFSVGSADGVNAFDIARTWGTPDVRIDSSGNLLVGATSGINNGKIHSYATSGKQAYTAQVANDANSLFQGFNAAGSATFYATGDGSVYLYNIYTLGSGALPFSVNGAERMRLDSSGNLGLGVTPSAWGSSFVAAEIGPGCGIYSHRTSGQDCEMFSNFYTTNVAGYYKQNGYATRYAQTSGQHQWFNAPSGTAGNPITFTQAMTLDASGNLLVGDTSASGWRLYVKGATSDGTTYSTVIRDSSSTNLFYVRNDGYVSTGVAAASPYNNTTGSAANVFVDSGGVLYRSTSSARYKNTIVNATHGLAEVLKLRPVTYKGNNDGDTVFGGLIAEEVHDIGLTEFVQYNEKGEPDALAYGNMISLVAKAIQEQQEIINDLRARVDNLEKL